MAKLLGSLAVGDTYEVPVKPAYWSKLGEYIVWKVADKNHTGYPANSVTGITDKIIALLAFDAKEPLNSNADRKNYGNNRYSYANLLQWLNSNAAAGGWYSAKHTADASPASARVSVNPYDNWAGFLAMLDDNFVSALLNTTVTVVKPSVDGGGTETVTAKIQLPSTTEVGLANEGGIAEGLKLALFSDNASRVAYCTQEAINTSAYTSDPTTSAAWYWWLRTPPSSHARYVRFVITDGTLNINSAYVGFSGVRPLCNLPSGILVSDSPNARGNYELIWQSVFTAQAKVDGVWHDGNVHQKTDGVWTPAESMQIKIDGVWRSV